jgi:MFS family permease
LAESVAAEPIPLRVQLAVYATGYLSTSMQNMAGLLIPLWVVVTLNPSPFVVGIILGARNFLPTLLSIHGGAMMDHLGAKRVMMAFAAVGVGVHLFYPLSPWIGAVIVLQMLGGLTTTMSWVGSQTLIGQIMKGDPTHSGRLSSAALIGNLTIPPIIGAAWDYLGAWGGFCIMALWSAGIVLAAFVLPEPSKELVRAGDKMRARDFLPRLSSYVEAFALFAIPAIAVVVLISIGFLMSAAGLSGAGAALLAGRLTRFVKPVVLLFLAVGGAIIFIALPPLTMSFWILIVIAMCWGASAAISMPLMLSIMSKSADARSQGKGVGLRITANRLSATILPVVMGAVAEVSGVGNSFFIIGGTLLLSLIGLAFMARSVIASSEKS